MTPPNTAREVEIATSALAFAIRHPDQAIPKLLLICDVYLRDRSLVSKLVNSAMRGGDTDVLHRLADAGLIDLMDLLGND